MLAQTFSLQRLWFAAILPFLVSNQVVVTFWQGTAGCILTILVFTGRVRPMALSCTHAQARFALTNKPQWVALISILHHSVVLATKYFVGRIVDIIIAAIPAVAAFCTTISAFA